LFLGDEGALIILGVLIDATTIELFQQFPTPPHRPSLDAVGVLALRKAGIISRLLLGNDGGVIILGVLIDAAPIEPFQQFPTPPNSPRLYPVGVLAEPVTTAKEQRPCGLCLVSIVRSFPPFLARRPCSLHGHRHQWKKFFHCPAPQKAPSASRGAPPLPLATIPRASGIEVPRRHWTLKENP